MNYVWVQSMGEMVIKEQPSTQEKHVPVLLCQPQIPHVLACDWARVPMARAQQLNAEATA